jgi:putative ABC transport system ATP-binding protein
MSPIVVRDLRKEYPTSRGMVVALDGVSFSLAAGALCAIVGPSGSGKSTLLALTGGLDVPTSGDVWVDAFAVHRMSSAQRARFRATRIGFVFQSNNLVPVLTAAENVALPLTLLRLSARNRSLRVAALLDELGLRDVARRHRPGARHRARARACRRADGSPRLAYWSRGDGRVAEDESRPRYDVRVLDPRSRDGRAR